MGSLALFHSVYGLRPAVLAAAERLRSAGHTVVTPDLYGVPATDSLAEGFALAERVSFPTMLARARRAVEPLPRDAVLAGVSMGTGMVQALLPERPHTAGVLLLAGAADAFDGVRPGLRAQLHVADPDPEFVPPEAVGCWKAGMGAAGALFEVYRYPGVAHLWFDEDLPDYDAPAAETVWERCAEFLRLS